MASDLSMPRFNQNSIRLAIGVQADSATLLPVARKKSSIAEESLFVQRRNHAMKVQGIDIADLARRMKTDYQKLSQLKTEPLATTAIQYAKALEVCIEWLVLGEGPMTPPKQLSPWALEIAHWFDALSDRDRARAHALTYQMFRNGKWPRLEDLRPDPAPTQAPQEDPGARPE